MENRVTVSIPATSANLGPGFDAIGMALRLRNEFAFEEVEKGTEFFVSGEGAAALQFSRNNLVLSSLTRTLEVLGKRLVGIRLRENNQIPLGGGLGSSAAAILAGIIGANTLAQGDLTTEAILSLAIEIEGHGDNVAPALFGGLTVVVHDSDDYVVEKLPVADLKAVVILPEYRLTTSSARSAVPITVTMEDAIFNVGRAALLVHALASGDCELLASAMQDRLHQPYRLPLVPGLEAAFEAARSAGTAGVALSGAGPALIAFAESGHELIAGAAAQAFTAARLRSRHWILEIDREGALLSRM